MRVFLPRRGRSEEVVGIAREATIESCNINVLICCQEVLTCRLSSDLSVLENGFIRTGCG
jgi:hypothetical protein